MIATKRRVIPAFLSFVVLLAAFPAANAFAQETPSPASCSEPLHQPIAVFDVDHAPRFALSTRDGCWIFVTTFAADGIEAGVVVMKRSMGTLERVRFVPLGDVAFGMTLTHDQNVLIVGGDHKTAFLDVE
jgi:hypothetical protein